VILFVAVLSCAATAWARLHLGPWAAWVPWASVAWTILLARRSRRGSFVASALLLGAIDGLTVHAAWIAWPLACLVTGVAAFLTRRLLPVRGPVGEGILGAAWAAVTRLLVWPLPPVGLPASLGDPAAWVVASALTGVLGGALVALARRWVSLRMHLTKVT
jgi:hypothetical protein